MVKMSLEKLQLEADPGSIDYSDERYMTVQNLFKIENKINNLIDLVNSQQEAIGELQTEIGVLRNMVLQSQEAIEKLQEHVDHEARHVSEPADDKPELVSKARYAEKLGIHDTHRTVTLRIPKVMRIGEAISEAYPGGDSYLDSLSGWLIESSDTDLQIALDEVEGESNE